MEKRIFIIDNYDSFTYNLVHLIEQLKVPFVVKRNDQFELSELEEYSHLLISPGPGIPSEAGASIQALEKAYQLNMSVLGVCLGMQTMLTSAAIDMVNMPKVEHGADSLISISRPSKLFQDLPDQISVGRYHSWAFAADMSIKGFRVTAKSDDQYIMAIEHESLPLFGVQFHPESIMTQFGLEMVQNWLDA